MRRGVLLEREGAARLEELLEESGMQADALLESPEPLCAAGLDEDAAALVAAAAGIAERLGYVVRRRPVEKVQRALTA